MRNYITIDGGTTNTRISLVKNQTICDAIKLQVGARIGIGDPKGYRAAIKTGISDLLVKNKMAEEEICCILASGMITCEYGLCAVDHIKTPAGIRELHQNMKKVQIDEISKIPFVFIPGVKTDATTIEQADMIRGEETELMGILRDAKEDCIYVLPGSHSKFLATDQDGRITDIVTMLTGEMIAALSQGTILKDAVDLDQTEIDKEYLLKGYHMASQWGINQALFKVRILKNLFSGTKKQAYSFFLGVVLCDEIKELLKRKTKTIVLGGRKQIKEAMHLILMGYPEKRVVVLDDHAVEKSTVLGMIKVYEKED